MTVDDVADQLRDELADRATALGVLLGVDILPTVEMRAANAAGVLAAQLCGDDDQLAAQTVVDLACVLWPHGSPDDWDPDWWRTPLGRQFARSIGHDSTDAVTYARAAAMLGIAKGTVSTMVSRGTLDAAPNGGGVMLGSVLERLARQV